MFIYHCVYGITGNICHSYGLNQQVEYREIRMQFLSEFVRFIVSHYTETWNVNTCFNFKHIYTISNCVETLNKLKFSCRKETSRLSIFSELPVPSENECQTPLIWKYKRR